MSAFELYYDTAEPKTDSQRQPTGPCYLCEKPGQESFSGRARIYVCRICESVLAMFRRRAER